MPRADELAFLEQRRGELAVEAAPLALLVGHEGEVLSADALGWEVTGFRRGWEGVMAIEPGNAASIAAHSLYENPDPFRLVECSGTLDLTRSRYEAAGDRAVKVSGSAFLPAERYTVKLEGAEKVGYQSVVIGSVRDPFIIRRIDEWIARLRDRIHARVAQVYGAALKQDQDQIHVRIYGKNGTMGPLETVKEIRSHELCLLIEVTAPTQEIASAIAGIVRHLTHTRLSPTVDDPAIWSYQK